MSLAQDMIRKIEQALADTPAGAVSITVDGQSVKIDREAAIRELRMWERRANREDGVRPQVGQINLGGAW